MAPNRGPESFPPYEIYLDQGRVWPRETNDELAFQPITDMAPNYAASALAKLIRWAHVYGASVRLNIADLHERLAYVRNTPLGKALSAQAQGLTVPEEREEPLKKVGDLMVARTVLTAIEEADEHIADSLGMERVFALSAGIAQAITREYELKERGS